MYLYVMFCLCVLNSERWAYVVTSFSEADHTKLMRIKGDAFRKLSETLYSQHRIYLLMQENSLDFILFFNGK